MIESQIVQGSGIRFQRFWSMPSADTFDCEPIKGFVQKYLMKSKVSVDPFARNKRWAKYTNDLNPETAADYHMDAGDFVAKLHADGVVSDLVIVDPPYSPRQMKECYDSIGIKLNGKDTQIGRMGRLRDQIQKLASPDATVLTFGWNTVGMGKGWEILEILLVCHGSEHNDTICMAERRLPKHPEFL